MKKQLKTESIIHIDNESGEVLSSESFVSSNSYDTEPSYFKIYVDDLARLAEVPKGMTAILLELVKNMSYGNVIPAYMPVKQAVCNNLGISINYLNKAIDTFYRKGIFIREARGFYRADPELFGKGKWKDVKELRLQIEYRQDGTKHMISSLSPNAKQVLGLTPQPKQLDWTEELEKLS